MSPRIFRSLPLAIAGLVFLGTCLACLMVHRFGPDSESSDPGTTRWIPRAFQEVAAFFHRLELITRDARVFEAARQAPQSSRIGLVTITPGDLKAVQAADGSFYPLIRHVYAALLEELAAQGAAGVVLDVFLLQPHTGIADPTSNRGQPPVHSDERLARALAPPQGMPVILIGLHDAGSESVLFPDSKFATAASSVGHATWMRDVDTVVRRAEAYVDTHLVQSSDVRSFPSLVARLNRTNDPVCIHLLEGAPMDLKGELALHPTGQEVQEEMQLAIVDLLNAAIDGPRIYEAVRFQGVTLRSRTRQLVDAVPGKVPVRVLNRMLLEDAFAAELSPNPTLPDHVNGDGRLWHAGIQLAAAGAGLDLDSARPSPERNLIMIPYLPGSKRDPVVIPVNEYGDFLIDWSLRTDSPAVLRSTASKLLEAHKSRRAGTPATPIWKDRLVVIAADIPGAADRGSTPLGRNEMEASGIWNIAQAVLNGRFPRVVGLWGEFLLITLLTGTSAILSWRFRALWASVLVLGVAAGYVALAFRIYDHSRLLVPVVFPVLGALLMTHVAMVSCRLASEWIESFQVRGSWRRILSRSVFKELERAAFQIAGSRHRQATVVYADLRGFVAVLGQLRQESPAADGDTPHAEADHALMVVNGYLNAIAKTFRNRNGTLDKFIGDCVMAFWGAPIPSDRHAALAVQAAIDAQRLVQKLNRITAPRDIRDPNWWEYTPETGRPSLVEPLRFGIGINTGRVVAGFVGSGDTLLSYTVLGPEVNLASRLEGEAGGDEILISAATLAELQRTDPDLARRCEPRGTCSLKGLPDPVPVYTVRWQEDPVPSTAGG